MKKVDEGNEACDVCNTERAKRLLISRQVATRAKKPLDIVHVDISPVNTTSIDDFKYALGFVDSFSRFGAVYLLRTRAKVGPKLLRFIAELGKPRKIVTDNAKEFKIGTNGHKDFGASCVDDLVYCSDDNNFYETFEKTLSKKFLISEVDDLNWFLGMQIRRGKGRL